MVMNTHAVGCVEAGDAFRVSIVEDDNIKEFVLIFTVVADVVVAITFFSGKTLVIASISK
jgi:hypothetical protein